MKKQKPPLDSKHLTGQAKSVIRVNQFLNPSLSVTIAAVFAVVIMGVLGFGGSAEAEVFVNENFDNCAFDIPYKPHKYICDTPEPPDCTNTATYVTDIKRAGTCSLECVYNEAGAAGIKIFPSYYCGHDDFGSIAHVRLYFKHDAGFRFHDRVKIFRWHKSGNDPYVNTNGCGPNGYIQSGYANGSQYGDIAIFVSDSGGAVYVANEMAGKGENPADWVVTAGDDWWMVEAQFDTPNHIVDLWVQRPEDAAPTKVLNGKYFAGLDNGNLVTIDFNWLNATDGGSGGKLWVDEIVIADEYIGPIDAPDLTPPTRSNPQPIGALSSGTTSTTISLDTDETAVCKYSANSGTNYDLMTFQLSSGQANSHSTTISNLSDGETKTYYIRCQDESNNQNTDDFEISFSIASSTTYSISNFINLVTDWLKTETGLTSDVNGDGVVNTRDLGIMMSNWQ